MLSSGRLMLRPPFLTGREISHGYIINTTGAYFEFLKYRIRLWRFAVSNLPCGFLSIEKLFIK